MMPKNAKRWLPQLTAALLSAASLAVAADPVRPAAPPVPKTATPPKTAAPTKPAATAKPAEPAPSKPQTSRADEAARKQILASRQWREMQHAFNEWLSIQKIYSPAEVKQIKVDQAAKVAKMSAVQLTDFLEDSRDKLKILMSKEAEDARMWLAQRMAVEVHLTPQEIKESQPDVVHMTAAQMEEWLAKLQLERKQIRSVQQGFDQGRKQEVKDVERQEREQEKEREEALDRAYYDQGSAYGGYYGGANNQLRYGPSPFYGGYRY